MGQELLKTASSFDFEIRGLGREDFDITDKQKLKNAIEENKPDILINATAYNLVVAAESKPEEAMAVNHKAVANMAKICSKSGIRFVTFSTDYVFDGQKGAPYEEGDIPNPLQVYGQSKLAGENAVLKHWPDYSYIIRTMGVYGGEKGSPGKGNFVLNILKEARDKKTVEVSCEQIVNPTYTADLAKATLGLIKKDAKPGVYHLASEGYCNWYEFSKEIFRLAQIDTEAKPVDRSCFSGGVRRPRFSALKNTKAKALGITLPTWQEGLRAYFSYLNSL